MSSVEEYVTRIEEACGEDKQFIVVLRYDLLKEAIARILERAKVEKSISQVVFDLDYGGVSFRLYSTGKIIFRNVKGEQKLKKILGEILL